MTISISINIGQCHILAVIIKQLLTVTYDAVAWSTVNQSESVDDKKCGKQTVYRRLFSMLGVVDHAAIYVS